MQGFGPSYDTWEPRQNLRCTDLLESFEASRQPSPTAKRPSAPSPPNPKKRPLEMKPLVPPKPKKVATPKAAASPKPPRAPQASLEVELQAAFRGCECKPCCSLLPLIEQGALETGPGVLTCSLKGELFFADLTPAGTLITKASDGSALSLPAPCNLVHLAWQRLGAPGQAPKQHPHKCIYYKGVKLNDVRVPQRRPR